MSSPVRRSLILATLMALLLGVSGLTATIGLARNATSTTVRGIDVDAATIPELQAAMDSHKLTSVQLTTFYIQRIRNLNPKLNAVIKVSPTALLDARRADRIRRRGVDLNLPLLGIPVIVKDNVNTTGMPNTGGSWALAGSTPSDAFIIQRMRAAGAIVIAKANLSEWANFRSIPSSSGWSGIGGQTNMAYVLDRNPCGSSSGTGVSVSADLATVGVGTETDGSIVCPSGANGIVGIKPTLGLLSRAGVIPISADQDTAGPMARNVTDAAVLLGAMTGIDPNDAATAAQAGHAFTDYTQFLDADALDGARIGIWRSYDPDVADAATVAIFEDTVETLEGLGATIVDPVSLDLSTDVFNAEFAALLCEFKTDIATYLQTYTDNGYPKTLQGLIDFNNAHPELEGPWNSAIFDLAQDTGGRAAADCVTARADTTPGTQALINSVMATNNLDAIVAPTNNPAWVTDPVNGDSFEGFVSSSSPSAISGYASITVPSGYVGPLPVGVSFIGGRWDEPTLIALAYAFEQATHVRVPPQFIPSIGDGPSAVRQPSSHEKQKASIPGRNSNWKTPLR
jgi:amidase